MPKREREIARLPGVPTFTEKRVACLADYIFLEKPNFSKTDLLFCFGTNAEFVKMANHIDYFIKTNSAKDILITGGKAEYSDIHDEVIEAESVKIHALLAYRHTAGKLWLETKSTNTLENVTESLAIIDLASVENITFITHSFVARRSYLTLRRFATNSNISTCCFDVSCSGTLVSQNNWHKTELGKSLVWGEYLRIMRHGQRGDICLADKDLEALEYVNSVVSASNRI